MNLVKLLVPKNGLYLIYTLIWSILSWTYLIPWDYVYLINKNEQNVSY